MQPLKADAFASSTRSSTLTLCLTLLLILSLTAPLAGCGGSSKMLPIAVDTLEAERPPERPPLPEPNPVELVPVDWTVVEADGVRLLALTPQQYENLTLNLAELLRWIQEAAWRLRYYGER